MTYEKDMAEEVIRWKRHLVRRPSLFERTSKKAQNKLNGLIPEKVHTVMTESIKKMVQATLVGSNITTFKKDIVHLSLEEREKLVKESIKTFQKTAAVEGAGTGAGGIFLGLADFPLLLSIKMKFLFEAANLYGYDTKEYEERLFLLYVFQLAFSSEEHRESLLELIENWDERKDELKEMDWRVFQQEYRDYIDLVKMLQLMPGIGAVVGGIANYKLLQHLGECAMNAYRIRKLKEID
ncbi:EcsC family protein [Metabacillus herbersteinensis]|uniref:EcsC family protein n=1 Tax=Metabacillus herbersteinensis TaxID=283816 RepID=A0ABV6GF12_9BACI